MTATTFDKSQAMALKLGDAAQVLFCTFDVTTKDGGVIKKPIQRGGKPGVSAVVSDEALFTADDIYRMEAIKHGQYFGLNMNKSIYVQGRGHLVCLDVDMKHKPEGGAVHLAIKRLVGWVEKVGALNELSVSGKGHHVFVFAKTADNILRKYTLAQGQEVEIFGLESSDKKSILLTGEAMEGEVIEVDDLEALFIELGIDQQKIAPESVSPKPSRNLDYLNLAPVPAPRTNQEALRASLQAPARQYVNHPHETYLKAVEALRFLDPNMSEPDWWTVCVALQNEFGENGREMWNEWSSKSPKYKGRAETDYKFDRATQGGGVGIGTLFFLAQKGGYQHPEGFSGQSAQTDFSGVTIDNETGEMVEPHFLARFIDLDGKTKPPRWVIPGFIEHTVVVISGSAGVGKTTALLPLALTAAGLHGEELKPVHWRHVVYVTEDVEQVKRILAGIVNHGNLGIEWTDVRERLHIVPAKRLKPEVVASVGATYREKFTRMVDNVEILPLVVLDTKSAVLEVEDENHNSEASKMMAALKQGFNGLPVWLVGHVAKALRDATEGLSGRGAGAVGDDANQTMFLIKDKNDKRYLQNDKKRFEQKWPQIDLISHIKTIMALDEFGNPEEVTLRWAIAQPGEIPNKELAEQRKAERTEQEEKLLLENTRYGLLNKAAEGWILGIPYNKTGLKNAVAVKAAFALKVIEKLFHERWLHEIDVPRGERVVNSRASYVIALTTPEHDALLAGEDVLQKYRVIPASWKKAPIPIVPGVLAQP
jgi:RecA-family ATPase